MSNQKEFILENATSDTVTAINTLAAYFDIHKEALQTLHLPPIRLVSTLGDIMSEEDDPTETHYLPPVNLQPSTPAFNKKESLQELLGDLTIGETSYEESPPTIMINPEQLTSYDIGRAVGHFLYHTCNPAVFQALQRYSRIANCNTTANDVIAGLKRVCAALKRRDPTVLRAQRIQLGYQNLIAFFAHSSGLLYNEQGIFPSKDPQSFDEILQRPKKPLPANISKSRKAFEKEMDFLEKSSASLEKSMMYYGMKAAQTLYKKDKQQFKTLLPRLARMPFKEARKTLLHLVHVDLLAE
ncbi:MAG: hypothetical protein Q7R96_04965 [Nanoarchaeota archaeon]|nr:hypothetical protein [Nanoarchaeota archaeon]